MTSHRHTNTEAELGYPTGAHGRIPAFANRDEEAAFGDTHDLTDFVGQELQPIEITIGGELAIRQTARSSRKPEPE